jgi:CubicO group peptidase (beta-lactamase class C family)
MRRVLVLAAVTFAVAVPPAGAQRWTLDDSVQRQIDSVFDFVQLGDPGCAVGVVQNGRTVFAKGYGLANLDWGIPLSPSTVFDIGSVSKQFTATAIALLDIDGVLSIDDDVRQWIPELPAYQRPITIRHLLNHTSGIRDYLTLMTLAGTDFDNVFDEFDGVGLITRQKALNFEPGSEHLYSNSGYLLLANIVRRAAGQSLREFLEERVFDPLGMAHTSIWDDNTEILHERATGYGGTSGDWTIDHAWNFQMGGDGQVITSVEDLARWDANFYDHLVGGPALFDRLHTRGVLTSGDKIDYALGLVVDEYRGLGRVQHGGAWAGFRAMLTRFPEQHTSVIIECNRGDARTGAYANAVADAVLVEQFPTAEEGGEAQAAPPAREREPVDLTRDQLARWEGVYPSDESPTVLTVELSDSGLVLEVEGQTFPLRTFSVTEFEVVGPGIPVSFTLVDGVARATAQGDTYARLGRATPSAAQLRAFVGRYWSSEIDATYEVTIEGDSLMLQRPGQDPVRLIPLTASTFHGAGLRITFVREGRRVTRISVDAGRVKGILFERDGQGTRAAPPK